MTRIKTAVRFAGVLFAAAVVTLLSIACSNDEPASSNLPVVPTPIGAVVRKSCESIAATDYYLSDEERDWFVQNCNRLDCTSIRGTQYRSAVERTWYQQNCP
jgi:hypothetical protein